MGRAGVGRRAYVRHARLAASTSCSSRSSESLSESSAPAGYLWHLQVFGRACVSEIELVENLACQSAMPSFSPAESQPVTFPIAHD